MDSCKWLRGLALIAMITIPLRTAWSAAAAPIVWNLGNVTFDDGSIATGTFTMNNGTVTSWHIKITGGTTLPAFTYDPANSHFYGPLPDVHFMALDNLRYLRLHFSASLADKGTDPILTKPLFTSYECGNNPSCSVIREVKTGKAKSAR